MIKRENNVAIVYLFDSFRRCIVYMLTQLNQTVRPWYLVTVSTWKNIQIILYCVPLFLASDILSP